MQKNKDRVSLGLKNLTSWLHFQKIRYFNSYLNIYLQFLNIEKNRSIVTIKSVIILQIMAVIEWDPFVQHSCTHDSVSNYIHSFIHSLFVVVAALFFCIIFVYISLFLWTFVLQIFNQKYYWHYIFF